MDLQTRISVSDLSRSLAAPEDTAFSGVVTLIWPYSVSTHSITVLLADPDFRKRTQQGQVRVHFYGAAANALAKAHIQSGDSFTLSLGGAVFVDKDDSVNTPGRGVDFDLSYTSRLTIEIVNLDKEVVNIAVEGSYESTPELPALAPSPPQSPPPKRAQTPPRPLIQRHGSQWSSPLFKHSPRAFSSSFRDKYEPRFDDEEASRATKRLKITPFGPRWRYKATDSPERDIVETPVPTRVDLAASSPAELEESQGESQFVFTQAEPAQHSFELERLPLESITAALSSPVHSSPIRHRFENVEIGDVALDSPQHSSPIRRADGDIEDEDVPSSSPVQSSPVRRDDEDMDDADAQAYTSVQLLPRAEDGHMEVDDIQVPETLDTSQSAALRYTSQPAPAEGISAAPTELFGGSQPSLPQDSHGETLEIPETVPLQEVGDHAGISSIWQSLGGSGHVGDSAHPLESPTGEPALTSEHNSSTEQSHAPEPQSRVRAIHSHQRSQPSIQSISSDSVLQQHTSFGDLLDASSQMQEQDFGMSTTSYFPGGHAENSNDPYADIMSSYPDPQLAMSQPSGMDSSALYLPAGQMAFDQFVDYNAAPTVPHEVVQYPDLSQPYAFDSPIQQNRQPSVEVDSETPDSAKEVDELDPQYIPVSERTEVKLANKDEEVNQVADDITLSAPTLQSPEQQLTDTAQVVVDIDRSEDDSGSSEYSDSDKSEEEAEFERQNSAQPRSVMGSAQTPIELLDSSDEELEAPDKVEVVLSRTEPKIEDLPRASLHEIASDNSEDLGGEAELESGAASDGGSDLEMVEIEGSERGKNSDEEDGELEESEDSEDDSEENADEADDDEDEAEERVEQDTELRQAIQRLMAPQTSILPALDNDSGLSTSGIPSAPEVQQSGDVAEIGAKSPGRVPLDEIANSKIPNVSVHSISGSPSEEGQGVDEPSAIQDAAPEPASEPAEPAKLQPLAEYDDSVTSLSTFTALKNLRARFRQNVDILAIITAVEESKPKRASGGQRDFFVNFTVADPSNVEGVPVTILRPYKDAVPDLKVGNGVLLRDMQVATAKNKTVLNSTESAAWVVFDVSHEQIAESVSGPPVEYEDPEVDMIWVLWKWYRGELPTLSK